MRTLEEIAEDRAYYESEIARCDDEEQAWGDMSRLQRVTEQVHRMKCCSARHPSCSFHRVFEGEVNQEYAAWEERVKKFLDNLPKDWPDTKVIAIMEAIPK